MYQRRGKQSRARSIHFGYILLCENDKKNPWPRSNISQVKLREKPRDMSLRLKICSMPWKLQYYNSRYNKKCACLFLPHTESAFERARIDQQGQGKRRTNRNKLLETLQCRGSYEALPDNSSLNEKAVAKYWTCVSRWYSSVCYAL